MTSLSSCLPEIVAACIQSATHSGKKLSWTLKRMLRVHWCNLFRNTDTRNLPAEMECINKNSALSEIGRTAPLREEEESWTPLEVCFLQTRRRFQAWACWGVSQAGEISHSGRISWQEESGQQEESHKHEESCIQEDGYKHKESHLWRSCPASRSLVSRKYLVRRSHASRILVLLVCHAVRTCRLLDLRHKFSILHLNRL